MNFESMSLSSSPTYRRLSTASNGSASKREEELINAYEAEEERIINTLSRKLEQLREEKISLERTHEEESESQVNRLTRELAALRLRTLQQQQQQQQQQQSQANGSGTVGVGSNGTGGGGSDGAGVPVVGASSAPTYVHSPGVLDPSTEVLLAALKKENESLRDRLVAAERDYVRVMRWNEIYREELIEHRRRLGLPVDNLIGLSSATDPYSQPLHRRASTPSSSPVESMLSLPTFQGRPSSTTHSMPIPRPSSQVRRAHTAVPSIYETPLSRSPSSAESPSLSPMLSIHPESYVSHVTHLTTPASSTSLHSNPPGPYPSNVHDNTLSYPSVPPPSLSSSLGSPVVTPYIVPSPIAGRDGAGTGPGGSGGPPSPVALAATGSSHRSNSMRDGRRVVETGNLRDLSFSRRASVERGARLAETGTLAPRSRAGSTSSLSQSGTTGDTGSFVPSLDETTE